MQKELMTTNVMGYLVWDPGVEKGCYSNQGNLNTVQNLVTNDIPVLVH